MVNFKIQHANKSSEIEVTLLTTAHSKDRAVERDINFALVGQAIKTCLDDIIRHADRVDGYKRKHLPRKDLALVSANTKLTVILAVEWVRRNTLQIVIKTVMRNGRESVRLRKKDTFVVNFMMQ